LATCGPEETDGIVEDDPPYRRLDDRQGQHGITRQAVRSFVPESLEDFLDHGQARNDLIDRYLYFQIEWTRPPKELDPHGGIDERHDWRRREPSRRMAARSPVHAPEPRSSRIRRAFARRTKSSSATSTARE